MTEHELQKIVEEVSMEVFHKPFRHLVKFNRRLRSTGGRYMLDSHNIEINDKHYGRFGFSELEGIIKHELCHYHLHLEGKGYRHGDADFKALIRATNTPRHCSAVKEKTYNYEYHCKECGQVYRRVRVVDTVRYRCGKCSGKLVLTT